MTRERRLDVVEVLAPLKNTILCHRFGLLDVRLPLCLVRQAKAVGAIFRRNV